MILSIVRTDCLGATSSNAPNDACQFVAMEMGTLASNDNRARARDTIRGRRIIPYRDNRDAGALLKPPDLRDDAFEVLRRAGALLPFAGEVLIDALDLGIADTPGLLDEGLGQIGVIFVPVYRL